MLHNNLTKISGIGNKLANQLIKSGVTSINDLKKDKFFNRLPAEAKLDLTYNFCEKIDRGIADELIKYLPADLIPVGSYRREIDIYHDLDFLCLAELQYESDMIHLLGLYGKKFKVIAEFNAGEKKRSFALELRFKKALDLSCKYIKIDLFKTTEEDMPFALFHYTGNKTFNIRTRAQAKRLGYTLNQYGLFKNTSKISVNNEKELFDILQVTYKKPSERND